MNKIYQQVMGRLKVVAADLFSNITPLYFIEAKTHSVSFADAIETQKHIGVFKKPRRQRTNFRRT